jgi:hypothetical protein
MKLGFITPTNAQDEGVLSLEQSKAIHDHMVHRDQQHVRN